MPYKKLSDAMVIQDVSEIVSFGIPAVPHFHKKYWEPLFPPSRTTLMIFRLHIYKMTKCYFWNTLDYKTVFDITAYHENFRQYHIITYRIAGPSTASTMKELTLHEWRCFCLIDKRKCFCLIQRFTFFKMTREETGTFSKLTWKPYNVGRSLTTVHCRCPFDCT